MDRSPLSVLAQHCSRDSVQTCRFPQKAWKLDEYFIFITYDKEVFFFFNLQLEWLAQNPGRFNEFLDHSVDSNVN
jgi:hypothetical protein